MASAWPTGHRLPLGSVWTIDSLDHDECGFLCCCLQEKGDEIAWWVGYFRPVRETSIDCFRELLTRPPGEALERERDLQEAI